MLQLYVKRYNIALLRLFIFNCTYFAWIIRKFHADCVTIFQIFV